MQINQQKNDYIKSLIYSLRKRHQGKTDLYIGAIALLAGQCLISNYYRTHKYDIKSFDLIAYILENITEFQEILNKYKI